MLKLISVCIFSIGLFSCSNSSDTQNGDHAWKEQTDTIDKAKNIEEMIKHAAEQQREYLVN